MNEEKKVYYVRMETSNPSANKSGYFESRELAEKEIKEMEALVSNDDYYGPTTFHIEEIAVSNLLLT